MRYALDVHACESRTFAGSLAAATGLLLAIPATRNSVLLPLFGVAYDRTIKFHQWLGWSMAILTSAHFAVTWGLWAGSVPPVDPVTATFTSAQYTYGFVAWILILVTLVIALPFVRARAFNFFYYALLCALHLCRHLRPHLPPRRRVR